MKSIPGFKKIDKHFLNDTSGWYESVTTWYYFKLQFILTNLDTNCLLHWHRGWSFFQLVEKAHLQCFCTPPLYVNSHISLSYWFLVCYYNVIGSFYSGWPWNLSNSLCAEIVTFAIGWDWTFSRYARSCM